MSTLGDGSRSTFLNPRKDAGGAMPQKICRCHYKHYEILVDLSKDLQNLQLSGFEAIIHDRTNCNKFLYALFHTVLYFGRCKVCNHNQYDAAVDSLLKEMPLMH